MVRRIGCAALAGALLLAAGAAMAESQAAPERPDIRDVGEPILINRKVLALEMQRNSDLRDWVRLYGAPDYAEVQQVELDPPWAPYEVRLYYLDGNAYLAFGRVHVAPSLYDYGVRKYYGQISAADIDRLLTSLPAPGDEVGVEILAVTATTPPLLVETIAVEGRPVSN